jgi:hypothetical protein
MSGMIDYELSALAGMGGERESRDGRPPAISTIHKVLYSSSMNVHSTSTLHKLPFHAAWQISRSSRARESLQSHLTKLH